MTIDDTELRDALARLADRMPVRDLSDDVVRRGRLARRRHGWSAITAAAIAIALIVVGVTVVAQRDDDSAPAATKPTPTRSSASSGSLDPRAFQIAPPQIQPVHGPAPLNQRPCRPRLIDATAALTTTANGVVGVIRLLGDHCSLPLAAGPSALLDASGRALDVSVVDNTTEINPPFNVRPDLTVAAGAASWGFAWRGSWCGAPAAAVRFPLREDPRYGLTNRWHGALTVPLTGPSPACRGSSDSQLVRGTYGTADAPVQAPPPAWSGLTLSLRADPTSGGRRVTGVVATVGNSTNRPITLDPCPWWSLVTVAKTGTGAQRGTEYDGDSGGLDCSGPPRVVPANDSVDFPLPDTIVGEGVLNGNARPGTTITVNVAIAGVPTATARVRVR